MNRRKATKTEFHRYLLNPSPDLHKAYMVTNGKHILPKSIMFQIGLEIWKLGNPPFGKSVINKLGNLLQFFLIIF